MFPAQTCLTKQKNSSQTFPNFLFCSPVWERKCLKISTLLAGQERHRFLRGHARSSRPGGREARGDDGCSPQLCSQAVSQQRISGKPWVLAGTPSTALSAAEAEEGGCLQGVGTVVS